MIVTAWAVPALLGLVGGLQQTQPAAPQQQSQEPDYGVRLGQNGRLWLVTHPRLLYDDNVTLNNRRRRTDTIFLLDLNLRLRVKDPRYTFDLSYKPTYWHYFRFNRFRRFEHDARVNFRADFDGPYFGLNGGYQRVLQPVDAAFTNQVRIGFWNAGFLVGYKQEPYKIELEPTWLWLRVGNRPIRFFDYDHWLITGRLGVHATEPLWIILAGAVGRTNFPHRVTGNKKADNRIWEVRAGPDWTPMEGLTFTARLGYRVQDYYRGRGTRAFREDFRGFVYRVGIDWRPTAKTRFTIDHAKEVVETVLLANFTRRYRLRAAVSHRFHPKWNLSLIGNFDTGRESRRPTTQRFKDRVSGEFVLDHSVTSNIVAELSALYRNKRTNDNLGEYDNWRITAGVILRF